MRLTEIPRVNYKERLRSIVISSFVILTHASGSSCFWFWSLFIGVGGARAFCVMHEVVFLFLHLSTFHCLSV